MQIAAGIAEISYFQIFDQPMHLLLVQQQCRHHDHGHAIVRYAFAEIELRQNARP